MTLSALQDLFLRHRQKETGHWTLGQDPARTVYLEAGDVVFAQSNHPLDRLTHILVERGKLTSAQLDYALANLRPGLSIGKNLIEMGFITQRDLLDTARNQVERIVGAVLGTAEERPVFESRDLDTSIVRLPFDTPLLLLQALLALQNREGLLELLGPLNQVVVLRDRRIHNLALPTDLAELLPMLDGQRTLLELSREARAEPLRLGAFALFLREVGWARLHEMPPMDRSALDLALAPESDTAPGSAALLEGSSVPATGAPSLFSAIEAAAQPTTNLEHLTPVLDHLAEAEAVEGRPAGYWTAQPGERDPSGFLVETGQAILPTPSLPIQQPEPLPQKDTDPWSEVQTWPEAPVRPDPLDPYGAADTGPTNAQELLALPPPALLEQEPVPQRHFRWLLILGGASALMALLWFFHFRRGQASEAPGGTVPISAAPLPEPGPVSDQAPNPAVGTPVTESPVAVSPAPESGEPLPEEPVSELGKGPGTAQDRVQTLRRGDLAQATRQGHRYLEAQPRNRWTLRLEIACQAETLSRAPDLFPESTPDLWILPLVLRDGRGCYQVFLGSFPSKGEAEKRVRKLPPAFRAEGNRPKVFRIADIRERQ